MNFGERLCRKTPKPLLLSNPKTPTGARGRLVTRLISPMSQYPIDEFYILQNDCF